MIALETIKKFLMARRGTFIFDEALGIVDNLLNIKGRVETLESTSSAEDTITDNLVALSGVAENEPDLGTFTGTTITNDSTIKEALQELETALEANDLVTANLTTLSGVAANEQDLGTFTGTTITDDSTVKEALQELETAVETINGGVLNIAGANTDTNSTDASAISVTTLRTLISTGTTETRTLAVPTGTGKIKIIEMSVDNGPCTIDITGVVIGAGGTTATFDDVGDSIILMSAGSLWIYLGGSATIS